MLLELIINYFNKEDKGLIHIKQEVKYSPCCIVCDMLVDLKDVKSDKTFLMSKVGEHVCLLIDEHYMILKELPDTKKPEMSVIFYDDNIHCFAAIKDCFFKEHECVSERQEEHE